MAELLSLPTELLTHVLAVLDVRHMLRCRQVCSLFKLLVDQDVRAQYKVELAIAGMEDGPPSTLSPADRLAILRARQVAWDKLAWSSKDEVPMLRGGVWELYGGVLAQAEGKRTLVFKQLPSAIRGIHSKEWRIDDVGGYIRDFGMDPAQDLLLVIEHRREQSDMSCIVHLKSLTTGVPHPDAPKGGMLEHKLRPGRYSYAIQTSQDYLGILISSLEEEASELLIWNWKTGALRLHVIAPELPSFAFLTSRYIIIAVLPTIELDEENVLNIIQGANDPQLIVVDLNAATDHPVQFADLDYLCAFHYPPLSDSFSTVTMAIRSDPAPHWRPHPNLKVPFSVAREDRLFVITLWMVEGHMHVGLLSLVPSSTFLSCISTLSPGETRRDFEWSEWGPDGSRLIVAPPTHTPVWVCYVYGMTFAMTLWQGSQKVIFTLDFNPLAIRRARFMGEAGEEPGDMQFATLVTDPMTFAPARVFKEEVTTSLPYALRKMSPFGAGGAGVEGEGHFEAVMVGEDSLIMVSNQSHVRKYQILTF